MNECSVYEDLQDRNNLKRFMQTQLEDYNETPGLVPMNLVLFQDAIEHGLYATASTSTGTGCSVELEEGCSPWFI